MTPTAPETLAAVAVTGASGFVGRHLVAHLRSRGLSVLPLSRQPIEDLDARLIGDYTDEVALSEALAGVDVVIHLAARAHQRDTADAAALFRRANVESTRSIAKVCRAAGVRRLVFVSSIGVLGNRTHGTPFRETDPPAPVEPYAISKFEAEQVVQSLLAEGSTDYVIVRPPLVYGPGCPGNFGRLLQLAAHAPLLPLGGLHEPRRFVAVGNLVDALRIAAYHAATSRRIFLVADERDVNVAEILKIAVAAMGRSPRTVIEIRRQWLEMLAGLAGRGLAFEKLSAPLQIDSRAFTAATGWRQVIDPSQALIEAAQSAIERPKR